MAERALVQAIALSDANCPAAWYLGLTHNAQERWLDGGAAFEGAERCYRNEVELTRADQRLAATEIEPDVREARIAQGDTTIRNAEQQAAFAAFNAAFNYVRGGELVKSRPLLDRAVTHPAVSDRARELRAFVDR